MKSKEQEKVYNPQQILNGVKNALLKCNAITPENAKALEAVFNRAKEDLKAYEKVIIKELKKSMQKWN